MHITTMRRTASKSRLLGVKKCIFSFCLPCCCYFTLFYLPFSLPVLYLLVVIYLFIIFFQYDLFFIKFMLNLVFHNYVSTRIFHSGHTINRFYIYLISIQHKNKNNNKRSWKNWMSNTLGIRCRTAFVVRSTPACRKPHVKLQLSPPKAQLANKML